MRRSQRAEGETSLTDSAVPRPGRRSSDEGRLRRQVGALATNPRRDVQAPPPAKPPVVAIALHDVVRIVDHARPRFRARFDELLPGGGVGASDVACRAVVRRRLLSRGLKSSNSARRRPAPSRLAILGALEAEWRTPPSGCPAQA